MPSSNPYASPTDAKAIEPPRRTLPIGLWCVSGLTLLAVPALLARDAIAEYLVGPLPPCGDAVKRQAEILAYARTYEAANWSFIVLGMVVFATLFFVRWRRGT